MARQRLPRNVRPVQEDASERQDTMTYVHITAAPGYTVEDFNKVNAKTSPPQELSGLITWAAGTDARGLQVVAVWESKAHADRYAAEQLFPAFKEAGVAPGKMEMTDYDADEFYLRS
jgi:hypothetical protein